MIRKLLLSTALLFGACSEADTQVAETPATEVLEAQAAAPVAATEASFDAPDSAWRTVDPDNLIYIDTRTGRMIVELFPEIAPEHAARIRQLAGSDFYDGLEFFRTLDGFMNQTGDPTNSGTGDSGMADLPAEFTFRRGTDMPVTLVGATSGPEGQVQTGFYKGMPVATQPSSQAILTKDGKVTAYAMHCPGVLSMARAGDPDSANSQFFLMRGAAPFLDSQYTVWGRVVSGAEHIEEIVITRGPGEVPIAGVTPDVMEDVGLYAELDDAREVQVLDTNSDAFQRYLDGEKVAGNYPDICDISIPSRLN